MKTFKEFVSLCEEVEDKSKALGFQATIRRQNQGGRIGSDRRISDPERRRANPYKPRKDIGTQKQASTRVQQPEQERGSAALSPKESARKAYLERKAREAGGAEKPKDLTKQATKILSKTKPAEVDKRPEGQPKRAVVGMSRAERSRITKQGQKKLETLVRQSEAEKQKKKPEDVKLTGGKSKETYRTW